MAKPKEFFYIIERAKLDELGVAVVLDMLRYDGAAVECNAPDGYYLFRIEGHGPHLARWQSFGITIPSGHISSSAYDMRFVEDAIRKAGEKAGVL